MPPYASSGITHVVAGPGQPAQDRVLGGEAAGEREAALPLLERRERALERGAGRVGAAAVLVAAAQPADAVLLVGAGRVDGRDHRAGGRVGLVAGMDGAGLEAGLAAMVLGHADRERKGSVTIGSGTPSGRRSACCDTVDAPSRGARRSNRVDLLPPQDHPADRRGGAARPRDQRVRRSPRSTGPRRARRHAHRPRGLRGRRSSASAASGEPRRSTGRSRASGRPRSGTPAAPRRTRRTRRSAAAGPATPRPSGSSSTRRSSPTPTWSRRSSRSTTRPRACARATTSARSTARRSTTRRPSRSRPRAS